MLSLPRKIIGKTIIISPLNWGLGHASRIVPIIDLLKNNNKVIIAGEHPSLEFLQNRFPYLEFYEIGKTSFSFSPNFFQPTNLIRFYKYIKKTIEEEKIQAENLSNRLNADIIISDNRYGFYDKNKTSIIITHQLTLKTPFGTIFDIATRSVIKNFLKHFDEIWIPDNLQIKLAGNLSKNYIGKKAKYIGILSRFCLKSSIKETTEKKYKFCIILSGPEPSRSILEKKIIETVSNIKYKTIIIAGNTKRKVSFNSGNIEYLSLADDKTLLDALKDSENIIITAGYSSIMDMFCLKKKVFLIPTPKQTEQEYLAKYLSKKNPSMYTYLSEQNLHILNFIVD